MTSEHSTPEARLTLCTGDNPVTAAAIARQCGILPSDYRLPQDGLVRGALSSTSNGCDPASVAPQGLDPGHTMAHTNDDDAAASYQTVKSSKAGAVATTCTQDELEQRRQSPEQASTTSRDSVVLTGPEFRRRVIRKDGSINQNEFERMWATMRVMGRCSPKDKYTIVRGTLSWGSCNAVTYDRTLDKMHCYACLGLLQLRCSTGHQTYL